LFHQFVQLITADDNTETKNTINSAHYFSPDGRVVTFVDTPGFGAPRVDVRDADILVDIADFLKDE
jgi:hypothetical protein